MMDDIHHEQVEKATTSKNVEMLASDNDSSSNSGGLNLDGFSEEQSKALDIMLRNRVGKAIKLSMPYYVKETTLNIQKLVPGEFLELKKAGGFVKDTKSDKSTYRCFTACDVPKFIKDNDPIACKWWLTVVEAAFRASDPDCFWSGWTKSVGQKAYADHPKLSEALQKGASSVPGFFFVFSVRMEAGVAFKFYSRFPVNKISGGHTLRTVTPITIPPKPPKFIMAAPGPKAILSFKVPDQNSGRCWITCNPIVYFSGLAGTSIGSIGADVSFDTKTRNFTKYNFGLSYSNADLIAALTLYVGAEVNRSFSTNENTFTVGTQHSLDPLTTVKARHVNWFHYTTDYFHKRKKHGEIAQQLICFHSIITQSVTIHIFFG
ncbi:Eukaryotic porin/Tom40 [Artemisia annua]|uniref:Eukaryotic porin/Tom40 n=1 Tax=Artemisia annua TaxID=35608 RepID=A0A2U1L381_ARTAN|nr:Eukaryotic porin/Tom40 [Artemisia annua]